MRQRQLELTLHLTSILLLLMISAPPFQAAAFQFPGAPPAPAGRAEYKLEGTVINTVTGEPVVRALVQLYGNGQSSVLTDHEGRFLFEDLPQMPAMLNVRKPGFISEDSLDRNASPRQRVDIGPNSPPAVLRLVPEAIITGRVTDQNGEALEGISVRIGQFRIISGRKQWQQRAGPVTDEQGEFRVAGLTPGAYYVATLPALNRALAPPEQPEEAFLPVYYPGVAEMSEAAPVQLVPGQHTEVNFSLKSGSVLVLSGVITGYLPGHGVNLQVLNESGESAALSTRFNPQTGKFEARVAAGEVCRIKAQSQDALGHPIYSEAMVNGATNNTREIRMALGAAVSIPIEVKIQNTRADPSGTGMSTGSMPPNGPLSVRLGSLERFHSDVWATVEGAPDHPSFALRNVEAGRYRVEVMPNYGSWYVHSVVCGNLDLSREELTVTTGNGCTMDIVLRDDSARLAGSVHSTAGQTQAEVVVVGDQFPSNAKTMIASGTSEFQLAGLAPGNYRVFAFDSIDGLEYTNPDALRDYSAKAAEVTLQPDQETTVSVDLIRRTE